LPAVHLQEYINTDTEVFILQFGIRQDRMSSAQYSVRVERYISELILQPFEVLVPISVLVLIND
jgi:hypothetical protein